MVEKNLPVTVMWSNFFHCIILHLHSEEEFQMHIFLGVGNHNT